MKTPIPPPDDEAIDAEPTPEELAAAEALRRALESPTTAEDDAALLRSLKAAHAPRDLSPGEHRTLVDRAIAVPAKRAQRGVVIRVAFGVSAAIAAAAAVVMVVRSPDIMGPKHEAIAPFLARSTQALFSEPFPTEGGTTARIDRIAAARAAEFRENQFAAWGIR